MVANRPRLLYVDNLRTYLIVMVILWHMAITYGASGFWPYRESRPDERTSLAYTIFGVLNQPYVLGFFFLIAGYFTPGSYDRKGPARFYLERLLRLAIPLLIYVWLIGPLIQFALQLKARSAGRSVLEIWGPKGAFWRFRKQVVGSYSQTGPDVGPMWFVEMLLALIVVYGLVRLAFGVFKGASKLRDSMARRPVPGSRAR